MAISRASISVGSHGCNGVMCTIHQIQDIFKWIVFIGIFFSEMLMFLFFIGREMKPYAQKLRLLKIIAICPQVIWNILILCYGLIAFILLTTPKDQYFMIGKLFFWTSIVCFSISGVFIILYFILKYTKFK